MILKAQLIQFTDQQKGTKKVTWTIYRPDEKKVKKYWKVAIELSINDNTKIPQIDSLPSSKLWNLLTQLI